MRAEEFDKQLQIVLKGQPFAYDPAAWEGMERMLDAEKNKKRAWWMWFWPAMLFAGLSGAAWFVFQSPGESAEKPASLNKTVDVAQREATANTTPEATTVTEPIERFAAQNESPNTESPQNSALEAAENETLWPTEPKLSTVDNKPAAPPETSQGVRQASFAQWIQQLKRKEALLERQKLPLNLTDAQRSADVLADFEPKKPMVKPSFAFGPQIGGNISPASAETQAQMTAFGGLFAQMQWKRLLISVEPSLGFVRAEQGRLLTADTNYAFGYTITTDELRWNDQLEMQLPLLLGFSLGKRHQLLAGPVFHQYLNSAFEFERIRYVQGQEATLLEQQSGRGQIPGLTQIPMSWLFRYQFRLNDAFGLGIQYHPTAQPTNGLNWQVQLRYQLVKIR